MFFLTLVGTKVKTLSTSFTAGIQYQMFQINVDAHLGRDARDFQCHNNGELFREKVAVQQQLGGGKAHGGMRAGEMQTPHFSGLLHVHSGYQFGGVLLQDKRQEIQREQICRQ